MSADPRHQDERLVALLRAALDDDADGSRQLDVDQVWSEIAAQVPARRRRRALQRASLAAGLVVVVVAGVIGSVVGLQALHDSTPPPPASSGPVTSPGVEALLPAPQRTPRATSTAAAAWVLPAQCAGIGPSTTGPASTEAVTARDGAGSYGAAIDVTQVARFPDETAARSALGGLTGVLQECAATRPDLTLTALGGGLTGVQVEVSDGAGSDGGPSGLATGSATAVVLVGDAVALLTTSGPAEPATTAREQVLARAEAFTLASTPDDTLGGRP